LFRAAVQWPWDPAHVIPAVAAGPGSRVGYRLARLVVDAWEDPEQRGPILALLASTAASVEAKRLLSHFVMTQLHVPLVRSCGFDHPEIRGSLLGAQTIGLCMGRYVLAFEPLASLEPDALVEIAGRAAQRILTTPLAS
jgi:Tetracyclin repressor-like, C-terminal domain